MKLTVLIDNNTFIDRYFLGEPGISFFIEADETRILFDCGYSDAFLQNARKMRIDLLCLDYLVFSHGHADHTWGVDALIREFMDAFLLNLPHRKPTVVAHPKTFLSTIYDDAIEIGAVISEEKLKHQFELKLSRKPLKLTERLTFLGEIPRKNDFESHLPLGRKEGESEDDFIPDDTALVYQTDEGLVIITGCAHAGICNTIEHARRVCSENRIVDIIGGLHLLNPSKKQIDGTVRYLKDLNLKHLHACHCTDLASKMVLASAAPLKEVGVGLTLEF
jgi:7,8-dihydropterin-6-yl-methyl-4-(beta-D-ribofuranosyl)aminobenzene 5'-phosphate synthase